LADRERQGLRRRWGGIGGGATVKTEAAADSGRITPGRASSFGLLRRTWIRVDNYLCLFVLGVRPIFKLLRMFLIHPGGQTYFQVIADVPDSCHSPPNPLNCLRTRASVVNWPLLGVRPIFKLLRKFVIHATLRPIPSTAFELAHRLIIGP
jgi:hypothetical protein